MGANQKYMTQFECKSLTVLRSLLADLHIRKLPFAMALPLLEHLLQCQRKRPFCFLQFCWGHLKRFRVSTVNLETSVALPQSGQIPTCSVENNFCRVACFFCVLWVFSISGFLFRCWKENSALAAASFNSSLETSSMCVPVGFSLFSNKYAASGFLLRSATPVFQSAGIHL